MVTDELADVIKRAADLRRDGHLREAELECNRVLAQKFDHAGALQVLGIIYQQTNRACEGLRLLRRAVGINPTDAMALADLATALGGAGRLDDAIDVLQRAVELQPGLALVHNNLGATRERMGRFAEAARDYAQAVDLDRRNPAFCTNWGNALRRAGDLDAAEAAHRRSLALRDDYASAWKGLALVLQDQGRLEDAMQALREAMRSDPTDAATDSMVLVCAYRHPTSSPASLLAESLAWARRHADGDGVAAYCQYRNVRSPGRRLRVGYLSPDMRDHPVGRLLEPVLAAHDHAAVEIFIYNDLFEPDGTSDRIRRLADHWRDVASMGDAWLAERIESDQIDIFVETAGHGPSGRLALMARRPAPLQVGAFGYCGTSGIGALDYLITDAHSDPPGSEAHYAERLLRLPASANCYRPLDGYPDIVPPPALKKGHVTFCYFDNPVKITDPAIELWSRILAAVGRSQLLMRMNGDGRWLKQRFVRHGIDHDRVRLVSERPRFDHMALYNRCDLALDTLPFNGDDTTLDALWMGVPVITLAGDRFASRRGLSHLTVLGHPEWIARTPDEYVDKAVALTGDLPRLARIRSGLREQFANSALGNVEAWTRDLEAAYRQIWVEWCGR
jgi:predicted O-linked N-acetylglucosamine transferase (SPINDLY family)